MNQRSSNTNPPTKSMFTGLVESVGTVIALERRGVQARLVGATGIARTPQGFEARGWWHGPDVTLLGEEWVVIHRKPKSGVESVSVAWPGSLGALAALADQLQQLGVVVLRVHDATSQGEVLAHHGVKEG